MKFSILGEVNDKKYKSRKKFDSEDEALSFAYSKVYTKSGNKKKKKQLSNFSILRL